MAANSMARDDRCLWRFDSNSNSNSTCCSAWSSCYSSALFVPSSQVDFRCIHSTSGSVRVNCRRRRRRRRPLSQFALKFRSTTTTRTLFLANEIDFYKHYCSVNETTTWLSSPGWAHSLAELAAWPQLDRHKLILIIIGNEFVPLHRSSWLLLLLFDIKQVDCFLLDEPRQPHHTHRKSCEFARIEFGAKQIDEYDTEIGLPLWPAPAHWNLKSFS